MKNATAMAGFAPERSTGVSWTLLVFLFLVAGAPSLAIGQGPKRDITALRLGFHGNFKPGFWVPVAVEIAGEGPAARGTLELTTPDADGLDTSIFQEVFLNLNERTTFYHSIKLGSVVSDIEVRLRDENGNVVAGRRFELSDNVAANHLQGNQTLILAQNAPSGLSESAAGPVVVADAVVVVQNQNVRDLPTQWFAYGSVNTVVLATRDSVFFDSLDAVRASALQTWVRQGGNLVLSVANNWQVVQASFLGPMLPAKLTGIASVRVPDVLETFANAKDRFEAGDDGLPVAQLADVRGRVEVESAGRPVVVTGSYGLGKVTLLAFDAESAPFSRWPGRQDFWVKLLDFPRASGDANQQRSQQYAFYGVNEMGSVLNSRLEDFPDVTVVPFGFVALLIFGYILLIGPIDYFVLKKVFGRLELTWITFPTMVIVISLAAYFAAHWLKGDALRINRVEFVDVDVPSETLRGTAFTAIFSPRIARYSLAYTPGLGTVGTWNDLGMGRQQTDRVASWLGLPESAYRGVYGEGSVSLLGRRGYEYVGADASAVENVPIQVWSVKEFSNRWLAKAGTLVEATFEEGDPGIAGTMTNRLAVPLKNVLVLYSDFVYSVDQVEPGATLDIETVKPRTLRDYFGTRTLDVGKHRYGYYADETEGTERLSLAQALLFSRLAKKTSESFPNHYLHDLDLSDRLDLGKVIVFAAIEAPGGKLWLDEIPAPEREPPPIDGQVRTETYLRLFLDLKKDHP